MRSEADEAAGGSTGSTSLRGVYYAAREMQAQMCSGEKVVVVGGGNLTGQAALFLSDTAEQVHMLLRSGDLAKSMSRYLVDRVRKADNVTVHLHTEATELRGEEPPVALGEKEFLLMGTALESAPAEFPRTAVRTS